MAKKWKLERTKQCANCPWRVGSDLSKIPNYNPVLHRERIPLTISEPGAISLTYSPMACHHSQEGKEEHCIGWLVNQVGPGGNIALRIALTQCTNASEIEVCGPQHPTFEDTLRD